MEQLKKLGAGFLDQMGGNRNKPPPDDLMVSCKKQLTDLREEVLLVKNQFSRYAHQVVEAAEASVTLSKSVDKFYSKANHPGRSESVNMYRKVQEDIANRAVNTFHITVENGLISELAEWVQMAENLAEKISNAESTRITAHDTQNRLISLQNEYQDKKAKKQTIFGGNREQDLEDLQQRISEASDAQKSLSAEYQKERNNISQAVKQLMEKRYRYFDRVYVQMLECQAEYFQNAANETKKFQRDIDYYRKQYPKTNAFHHSNGSETSNDLPNGIEFKTSRQKSSKLPTDTINNNNNNTTTTSSISASSSASSSPIQSPKKNKKPSVPLHRPPPPQYNQLNQKQSNISQQNEQQNTTTNSSTQSPSSSDISSPTDINNTSNINKSSSSPPQQQLQSTHDILNLDQPMPMSPPPTTTKPHKNNIPRQDSVFGGLLGGNGPVHDEHGIFNLANPNTNDMLMDFGDYNGAPSKSQNQHYSKSANPLPSTNKKKNDNKNTNNDHDPNDLFGDFFGASNASSSRQQNKSHPGHQSNDSTSNWLLGSHEPPKQETNDNKDNNNNKSLDKQMHAAWTAPSYNGHDGINGHSANNNTSSSSSKPSIPNSKTGKVPRNGAAAELTEKDKQNMVNMELSNKGKENAQKAYDAAMAEREAESKQIAEKHAKKVFFKDKHEQKLNHWEFENTVRRNIRTLIGKLPEVLPADLNWRPIPMTKLLNDAQLKKAYFKAVRVVHPDKSIGRGDSVENQVICDYVFQALEQGFNSKFG